MKHLKPFRLPKAVFLNFILMEMVWIASLLVPVQASGWNSPTGLSTAIGRIAIRTIPAVVHIEVTRRQEASKSLSPFEDDPFFKYFFNVPGVDKEYGRDLKGVGTGIIIDSQGHILTNNHVVEGAIEIYTLLTDGNCYPARLTGTDPRTDLAVIQISAKESLPLVTFGDSDKAEVGEWVVAIGHALGLDQSVTQGIISAEHRLGIMNPSGYQDFLQTDAAINPGNSGGPLLNLQGEVIGVNEAIVSHSGGFEGIGFAIPSNMALHVARTLISHGKVERGWLGVRLQDFTPQIAESFHIEKRMGPLIADVINWGPAEKAGIKRGDIIISYKDKPITDVATFQDEVATTPVGQMVKLVVLRNGKKKEALVKIANLENAANIWVSFFKERLGADVRPIMSKEIEIYGLDSKRGVVITWLDPNGPLRSVGFEVNDMILEVNGHAIEDLKFFSDQASLLKPHQRITLLAFDHRSGRTGYVQVLPY